VVLEPPALLATLAAVLPIVPPPPVAVESAFEVPSGAPFEPHAASRPSMQQAAGRKVTMFVQFAASKAGFAR
jgi:hypothetical protein